MKTIKKNVEIKYEINKSIFITNLFIVKNIDEVREKINLIKKKYNDATHHCYAYIIDEIKKSSDDNEPSGTAGIPIMETLLKNDINYILCIVTRYFGGIKLGSGGLIRAYTKAVKLALDETTIINLYDGYKIEIICPYSSQSYIEQYIKKYKYEKEYNENVKYIVFIDNLQILDKNNIKYKILSKEKIELN